MNQTGHYEDINLLDFLAVLWRRKGLIIIGAAALAAAAAIYGFLTPPVWGIEAIFQPSKFLAQPSQTDAGQFVEVASLDVKQITGVISQQTYNGLIASELKLETVPNISAENLKDTNLIRIGTTSKDRDTGVKILTSLFNIIKNELDQKTQFEIKRIEALIAEKEGLLKQNELMVKDQEDEIQRLEIQKNKTKEEIASDANKRKLSDERSRIAGEEMTAVKRKNDELADQIRKVLDRNPGENSTLSLLLYSSQIQMNLQYFNVLNDKISLEKFSQEALRLDNQIKNEEIRQLDIQIDRPRIEIEKLNNDAGSIREKIDPLNERKSRVDYTQLIKAPTPSQNPISPNKKKNILEAGFLGLVLFGVLALAIEFLEKNKKRKTAA
jgi:capsular polysaccharide biosynthesis protein